MILHHQLTISPTRAEEIGTAVPDGFTLPWNTTRSMADVWSEWEARREDRPPKPKAPRKRGRPVGILVSPKLKFAGREE